MYEQGLMVKITNAAILGYLRSNPEVTNTALAENALCDKLGIPWRSHKPNKGGYKKNDCRNSVPVKIMDCGLIAHVMGQKANFGISYRHTVEAAILDSMRRKR